MTLLFVTQRAQADIDRLTDFLMDKLPQDAAQTARVLREGLQILTGHPEVGRPIGLGLRELVISRGNSGYLALYKYDHEQDVVLVLAIRHQRESGYPLN